MGCWLVGYLHVHVKYMNLYYVRSIFNYIENTCRVLFLGCFYRTVNLNLNS